MKKLVNASAAKAGDQYMIQTAGVPSLVLMERAAYQFVCCLKDYITVKDRILVVCGSGNNGGDGIAIARILLHEQYLADVCFAGNPDHITEETRTQMQIFETYEGKVSREFDPSHYTVIIDALFGIGLSRPVSGRYAELIGQINRSGCTVISVDIPSGISSDTGQILGCAVEADRTVTFGMEKIGQYLYPGREYCGVLQACDIGIIDTICAKYPFSAYIYEWGDLLRLLPVRKKRSNKGTYGKVLIIGGASGMSGALYMAGAAALKSGCGLVRLMAAEANRQILQTLLPEALYSPWCTGSELREALEWADTVAAGPGLGTSDEALQILTEVLSLCRGTLVLDADSLNLISLYPQMWDHTQADIVITPHPGEMARLWAACMKPEEGAAGSPELQKNTEKLSVKDILSSIAERAYRFARKQHVCCLLKDASTVICDGEEVYINTTGNSGMAVGGSGDVLTGVISGLSAMGMQPGSAAACGAYLHGAAGDEICRELGPYSMQATDLLKGLQVIMKKLNEEIMGV